MATRFYFSASRSSGVIPTLSGSWNTGNSPLGHSMNDVRGATTNVSGSAVGISGPVQYAHDRQYVSDPLAAQTIGGTGIGIIGQHLVKQQKFGVTGANHIYICVSVVSNDGSVVRGQLLTFGDYTSLAVSGFSSTATNRQLVDAGTYPNTNIVACQSGDRLVIEIGYATDESNLTSITGRWGESETALPTVTDASPATFTGSGWMEIGQDLVILDAQVSGSGIDGSSSSSNDITLYVGDTDSTVKYNIYSSKSKEGPWTLHNHIPLDNDPNGNSWTLDGLSNGGLYYIMVVGGTINDVGVFVPNCGQPITSNNESGSDINNPHMVIVRPKRISSTLLAVLGATVNLTAIGST